MGFVFASGLFLRCDGIGTGYPVQRSKKDFGAVYRCIIFDRGVLSMLAANTEMVELPSLEQKDAWDAPILFDEFETADIPASLLPGIFGEFAAALAFATETPEALSVMTVLGVISTAI